MKNLSRRSLFKASLAGAAASFSLSSAVAQENKSSRDQNYDVVVIGCGVAGMSAALEARKLGKTVCILEKNPRTMGNTVFAGGTLTAAGTYVQKQQGIKDSLDDFYNDMMKVSLNRGDPELIRIYVENCGDAIQWLTDTCGIKFHPIKHLIWPILDRAHNPVGPLKPAGAQLSKQMLNTVKKANIPVFFNTKVIELLQDDHLGCTGALAVGPQGKVRFNAKGGVVVATGGFNANKEMICKYMGGATCLMPLRGSSAPMGENIKLTEPFFPMLVNMDQYHGGPIHGPTRANPSVAVNFGIVTDYDANRIIDEAKTYVNIAKSLPKLVPDNKAFIILDDTAANERTVKVRLDRYDRAKAKYFKADTISDLAKQAGLPVEKTVKLVEEYNKACDTGTTDKLNPPNHVENAFVIKKAPFYAIPFMGGMTATFGGPKINKNAQLLNTENKPIDGLFGAGNAIGGIFYSDYIGGSQLTAGVVFGRIAGRSAAAKA